MKLEDIGITKEDILNKVADTLIDELTEDAKHSIQRHIETKIKDKIDAELSTIITETARKTFDSTYQPVDWAGNAKGEPTTIREMFIRQAKDWWGLKVDSNGHPSKDTYGERKTMAQYHAAQAMSEVVRDTMRKDFEPLLADAKTQLAKAFTQSISELVAKTIGKA